MSHKEVDRYEIIQRLIRGEINGTQAGTLLSRSTRQVRRLKSAVVLKGADGLVHGNRGKPSNRRLQKKERDKIVKLLRARYPDFKPTFACEKLRECHKIIHDPKTIRAIQIEEELWKPRRKKSGSKHRSWRQRRSSYGEMEQFDGSYEYWFEDRGEKCCLLAAIDDANGQVVKATFGPHEGVIPVFTFWKEYLEVHGKPHAIYLDKFSTYKMNSAVAKENHDLLTQFQRAAEDLHIELISANSPQAKGRVERLFGTFQDRLVKELRLAGISTPEAGNVFLKTYLPKFNNQFGVEAVNASDLHHTLNKKEQEQLPSIFSHQETRTIQNDFTLSYNKQWYQLTSEQPVTVCKRDVVIVEKRLDDSVWIRLRGKYLAYEILPERPKKVKQKTWVLAKRSATKPAAGHPWRTRLTKGNVLQKVTN